MSVDLWDLAERAESLVSKTNFKGMTKDKVIGLFYQEFCEPTVAEKIKLEKKKEEYIIKTNWMLENGFEKELQNNTEVYVYNKNFEFCKDDIELYSLNEIQAFVKIYNL